ncbi:MAG: alkene reductase [Candidatus Methylacidiphilales bacterium]|nr:alkene reductase [Candidatus Methylacidiphilales bacterium]
MNTPLTASEPTAYPALFQPLQLGELTVPNRVFMAPLTRMRAGEGRVPTDLNAEYYRQRSSAGLIISEATVISERGNGYPNTPGIHTDAQLEGWKKVTTAVHSAGGRIFLQLWHCGRVGHSSHYSDGQPAVAPSAVKITRGQAATSSGYQPHETPRALELSEIPGLIEDYRRGALRAKAAGFDGVEIHNANGYLLDQFLRDGTNHRTDAYGGSVQNRARLTLEVTEAVVSVWGAGRVGIRFSPSGVFNDMHDSDPYATFGHVIRELQPYGLAYLHITEVTAQDIAHGAKEGVGPRELRPFVKTNLVTAGGFTAAKASEYLSEGIAEAVAFGVPFIANPDLPERFRRNAPLNEPDESTFYSPGPKGYTDYPTLA